MSEENLNHKQKKYSFLKLKTEIQALFSNGKKINQKELKIIYLVSKNTESSGVKLFVAAPKRLLKHAVDRNTAKRRMREAFRLNISELLNLCVENGIVISCGIIHNNDSVLTYNIIEKKIVISLQKIYNEIYEELQKASKLI